MLWRAISIRRGSPDRRPVVVMSTVWLWSSASWMAASIWVGGLRRGRGCGPPASLVAHATIVPNDTGHKRWDPGTYTPAHAPHRDGDPVRDAPARGRVAAGARRGRRRRAVRRQAARRGTRPEGAGRGAAGRRDRPPPRAPRAGPGAGRARRRPRQGRAEPRDPGPARAVGRDQHRPRLPARRAGLLAGGRPGPRPGPRRGHRLARRLHHQRRPDAAQPQPHRLAPPAAPHRPRLGAVHPPHLA